MFELIEQTFQAGATFGKKFIEGLTKPISNVSSQQNTYPSTASKYATTYDKQMPVLSPLSAPKPIVMTNPFGFITEFMKEKTYTGFQKPASEVNVLTAGPRSTGLEGNIRDVFGRFQEQVDLGIQVLLNKIGYLKGITKDETAQPKQRTITEFHETIYPPELVYNPSGTFFGFEPSALISNVNQNFKQPEVDNPAIDPRADYKNVRSNEVTMMGVIVLIVLFAVILRR